jgi:hypothetical protein
VTEAMVRGQPVTAYRLDAAASQAMIDTWQRVSTELISHSSHK